MLIGQLRDGMTVGHGIKVVTARRDGQHFKITLSTGERVRLHKSAHVADLMVGHIPAESLMSSKIRTLREPRVSTREWRGENVGERGERFIARNSSHDARAVTERLARNSR